MRSCPFITFMQHKNPASNTETIAYTLHGNCYLNITNRCTLRCAFCPKFNKTWEVQGYPLRIRHEPDSEEILREIGNPGDYRQIVFCGLGEPTLRLATLLEVAGNMKQQGAFVRLNTDGLANYVHKRDITPGLKGVIDAVSISLNAQDEQVYFEHCRPPQNGLLQEVLEFVAAVKEHVPDVTLTAIDGLPGVDISACEKMAARLGVKFRRRVLDVVG